MRPILFLFSPTYFPFILQFVLSPAFLEYNTKCVAYAKALHINEKYIRPHKKHIQLQQKKMKKKRIDDVKHFFIFEKALFCSFPCRSITENVDEAAMFQVLPFLFCFESFHLSAAQCCLLCVCVMMRVNSNGRFYDFVVLCVLLF